MNRANISREALYKTRIIRSVLDSISLFSVFQYIIFRFLQSTMFAFVYSDTYKWGIFALIFISGIVRCVCLGLREWNDCAATSIDRRKLVVKGIVIASICVPFFYTGWKQNYKFLVFMPFIALCLYDMKPRVVLYSFSTLIGMLLAATIVCSLSGTVRNLVGGWGEHLWGSYGFINTSDFASYFTFLILFIWCGQRTHNCRNSITIIAACVLMTILVFWLTNSRTFLLCGILTALAIIWDYASEAKKENTRVAQWRKRIAGLSIIMLPLVCVAFFLCLGFYQNDLPWSSELNKLLSDRLKTTLDVYNEYGIGIFGSSIPKMHGNGATLVYNWSSGYGYLDSAVAMLSIRYGCVVFAIVSGIWVWMTKRAACSGNQRVALSMAIIAIHAFNEARFLDLNYNILLAMPLCSFSPLASSREKNQKDNLKREERLYWYKWILAVAMGTTIVLGLPKIMSWIRTIVALHGWTNGIFSLASFVLSWVLIALMITFWKAACLFIELKSKKAVIIMCTVLITVSCLILTGNSFIVSKCEEQNERLLTEESIIEIIKENATQPVYVAEESEIYQRFYGGFNEHVFSTEELFRPPQGTIITDINTESLGILRAWGWTVQISPWSRIYSYDQAVLEALIENGFSKRNYFDSERKCNLEDLAYRNGLKLNSSQELVLKGATGSISNNIEWDQFEGSYEVRFVFEESEKKEYLDSALICKLYVVGEAGETVIQEYEVYRNDGGKYCITIPYTIRSTPKVAYLIEAFGDISITVKEIAWKRVQ